MKNTTITIITAMILVIATVGTFFMEMISKDVLAGALVAIILPAALFFSGFKWAEDNAKEIAAKSLAKAEADDHLALNLQREGQLTEAAMIKQAGQKVEVQRNLVSV